MIPTGKTSLLNAIAGRLGALPILKGVVQFLPSSQSSASQTGKIEAGKIIGFVRQNDFLLPYLTVRETLTFAASLRLPRSVTKQEREEIVEQTIIELGLADVGDVIVGGGEGGRKGISGGERRSVQHFPSRLLPTDLTQPSLLTQSTEHRMHPRHPPFGPHPRRADQRTGRLQLAPPPAPPPTPRQSRSDDHPLTSRSPI